MSAIDELLGRTLVLVAHADDESIGCGALLQRIATPMLVVATNNAPRDEFFWKKHGSRLRYSHLRQEESRRALGVLGVTEVEFLAAQASGLDVFSDQELYLHLPQAYGLMDEIVRRFRPQALLTLAYEGGHPDHDACNFLAAAVARAHSLPAWEFPLYHRGPNGEIVLQRFLAPDETEVVLEITPQELERKREMLAAYASQQFQNVFDPTLECFRPLHAYDYTHAPHAGTLNYEAWRWPMTGAQVSAAFTQFLAQEQVQRP